MVLTACGGPSRAASLHTAAPPRAAAPAPTVEPEWIAWPVAFSFGRPDERESALAEVAEAASNPRVLRIRMYLTGGEWCGTNSLEEARRGREGPWEITEQERGRLEVEIARTVDRLVELGVGRERIEIGPADERYRVAAVDEMGSAQPVVRFEVLAMREAAR
ncbi:MAG: hypothetical protein KC619_16295 [Myxococcales bacterium]|nr:hypothetical protein [Myxococcales bacterium]